MSAEYDEFPSWENLSLAEEDLESILSHGQHLLKIADIICLILIMASILLNGTLFFIFCKNSLMSKYGIHFNILTTDIIHSAVFLHFMMIGSMAHDYAVWKMWEFIQYFLVFQRIFSVISLSTHRTFVLTKFLPSMSVSQLDSSVQSSNYAHCFVVWILSFVLPMLLISLKEYSEVAELITSEIIVLPLLPIFVLIFTLISCNLLKKITLQNSEDETIKESYSVYSSSTVVVALTSVYILNCLPSFFIHTWRLFVYLFEFEIRMEHWHWYAILHRILLCVNFVSHPIIVLATINEFKKLSSTYFYFLKKTDSQAQHDIAKDILLQEVDSEK